MLKTVDILNRFDLIDREKYKDMISQVNIPDFYKCIAQYSGLNISEVSDNAIFEYLELWCRNKYRFFQMLGNSIKLDQPLTYTRNDRDLSDSFKELGKQYPAYYLWLKMFKRQNKNKIIVDRWSDLTDTITEVFPGYNIDGTTVTHFLKSKLNAPDELITAVGRLFENDTIDATHTISIDPVDMMLASENPYNWTSCYRLETNRTDSHADGCLAAILDSYSLITYVWNNEGKYDLYEKFKFKNIKYYRMREWIAISKDWGGIHFNAIYPGRSDYDEKLCKQLRDCVERVVSQYTGVENLWRKNNHVKIGEKKSNSLYYQPSTYLYTTGRVNWYGYNEYCECNIYVNSVINPEKEFITEEERIKNDSNKNIKVYNEKITCPCGCGAEMIGSDEVSDDGDDDCDYEYDGEGFVAEHFYEREKHWCDYKDDYCGYNEECDCNDCPYYQDAHPECCMEDIDENTGEECIFEGTPSIHDGIAYATESDCHNCPRWKECHKQEEKEDAEEPVKED